MTIEEYLIENAVRQANDRWGANANHHHVVSYLRGSHYLDAANVYVRRFEHFDDLDAPLERNP